MMRAIETPTPPDNTTCIMLPVNPHALPSTELLLRLQVSGAEGLSDDEVNKRQKLFGSNTITSRRAASAVRLLLHQFYSAVVYLLGGAAGLAFYFGELDEGSAIVAVLVINATIGFVSELNAVRSIEALRVLGARAARVRREGGVSLVPTGELVPGDIVVLEAGDVVSADVRLIEASALSADESTLTGESVAVDKQTQPVSVDSLLGDRASMLFKGTAVTRGSGTGIVVATGLATELGKITRLVLEAEPGSSPLERKLGRLSEQLALVTIALAGVIGAAGLITGKDLFLMIEAAIALAVAAIPEGLPIVATLALARGMWRMARQNALIERLSAVETLGATTVILTDKTGTLTENRMTVRRLYTASGEVEVETRSQAIGAHSRLADDRQATALLRIAVFCNDAHLDRTEKGDSGDPMEIALLRAGVQADLRQAALLDGHRVVRKHAFDPATKMMATVHESEDAFLIAVKGAPEAVVAAATSVMGEHGEIALDDAMRAEWLARANQFGRHGLRVLACAMKIDAKADSEPYGGLVLLGLIGLEDPARADVPHAIRACRQAGIRGGEESRSGDRDRTTSAARCRRLRPGEPSREARTHQGLSGERRDRRHDGRRGQRCTRLATGRYWCRYGSARHRRSARSGGDDPSRRRVSQHRAGNWRRPPHLRQYQPRRRLPIVLQSQRSNGRRIGCAVGPAVANSLSQSRHRRLPGLRDGDGRRRTGYPKASSARSERTHP